MLPAVVRQPSLHLCRVDGLGVAVLVALEVDVGVAHAVLEGFVGTKTDTLDLQFAGSDVVGVGDVLVLGSYLHVEGSHALDVYIVAVKQLVDEFLLQGFHDKSESTWSNGRMVAGYAVVQVLVVDGIAGSACMVGRRSAVGRRRRVDVVLDAHSFSLCWHVVVGLVGYLLVCRLLRLSRW